MNLSKIFACALLAVSFPVQARAAEDTTTEETEPQLVLDPHLQYRPRVEKTFMGNISGRPANGNFRPSHRARLWLDGSYSFVSGRVMVQDVRIFATEESTVGDFSAEGLDVHEAWLQLGNEVGLKIGRYEINVDGQRLIGAIGWLQQAQSFDGATLFLNQGDFDGRAMWMRVPNGGLHDMFVAHPTFRVRGIYLSAPLVLQTNEMVEPGDRGARQGDWTRFTGGAYIKCTTECGGVRWRVEGYGQGGSSSRAFMLAGRVGYPVHPLFQPSFWFDYLSGDDPDTADSEAFDTLFGTNHKFYGYMDRFLNIPVDTFGGGLIDAALKVDSKLPIGKLHLAVHYFGWARETAAGQSGPIGFEADVVYTYPILKMLTLQVGASWFLDSEDYAGSARRSHDWFFAQLDLQL